VSPEEIVEMWGQTIPFTIDPLRQSVAGGGMGGKLMVSELLLQLMTDVNVLFINWKQIKFYLNQYLKVKYFKVHKTTIFIQLFLTDIVFSYEIFLMLL